MASFTSLARASPGPICPSNTVRRPRSTTASIVGAMRATGIGSWRRWPTPTTSIWSWWMARPCGHTIRLPRSENNPRRCLGRLRGGLSTKIQAFTNQDGLPIRFELTPGQAHDAPPCKRLLNALQPGQYVLADKAYHADWIREMIWEQGAIDVIPPRSNRKLPKDFDRESIRNATKSNASSSASKPLPAASQRGMRKRNATFWQRSNLHRYACGSNSMSPPPRSDEAALGCHTCRKTLKARRAVFYFGVGQEGIQIGPGRYGFVQRRVGTGRIKAGLDHHFRSAVLSKQLAPF